MGGFCQSKPQVSKTESSFTPDPRLVGPGQEALNMGQAAAERPFEMPAAPVAGFNPFQMQAFNQYQNLQGGTDPYMANARANMDRGASPVTQGDVADYQNPFSDQVYANLSKYIFDPQRVSQMGQETKMAGGVGADRLALSSQNIDKTQGDVLGGVNAGFYGQALGAAQEAKQRALQSAQGWANLGFGEQGAKLQATGALAGAGAQQQALEQAQLSSPYQQRLAEIAYPQQQANYLASLTGAMSNVFKGSQAGTTTTQPSTPSLFNQIAGLGMAGAGLMMGNPMMAMGGMGSMFGGGGGGAGYQSGSNSPSYPNPYGGSWYSNRGGRIHRASGGPVNPWDAGRGYYDGGDVEEYSFDMPNRMDEGAMDYSRPIEGPAPSLGMWPFNTGQADYKGDVTTFPRARQFADAPPTLAPPPGAGLLGPAAASPVDDRTANPDIGNMTNGAPGAYQDLAARLEAEGRLRAPQRMAEFPDRPIQAGYQPGSPETAAATTGLFTTPTKATALAATPPAVTPPPFAGRSPRYAEAPEVASGSDRSGGYGPRPGNINSDMRMSDFRMPSGEKPYPDATERDWGQKWTRSPWMSLVTAGLKMAQSTKSGAAGLAEGLEGGVKHLDDQRKELRSEEQINQKAQDLWNHAKAELDKYTRTTPHQAATEAETARYHDIVGGLGRDKLNAGLATGNLVYAGPVKDEPGMGYFYDKKRLNADGQPTIFKAPFNVGEKPGTAGKDSPRIAAWKLYKDMYPADADGAQQILLGHKTISEADVRKRVENKVATAMKAQAIQPGTDEWLEEYNRRVNAEMAQAKTDYGLK